MTYLAHHAKSVGTEGLAVASNSDLSFRLAGLACALLTESLPLGLVLPLLGFKFRLGNSDETAKQAVETVY